MWYPTIERLGGPSVSTVPSLKLLPRQFYGDQIVRHTTLALTNRARDFMGLRSQLVDDFSMARFLPVALCSQDRVQVGGLALVT